MTDDTPAEWALKIAEVIRRRIYAGELPRMSPQDDMIAEEIQAHFGPVLAAWDAWDCTVPVKSWQRIADAMDEFRKGYGAEADRMRMNKKTLELLERLIDEKIRLATDTPHGMVAVGAGAMPAIDAAVRRIAEIRVVGQFEILRLSPAMAVGGGMWHDDLDA